MDNPLNLEIRARCGPEVTSFAQSGGRDFSGCVLEVGLRLHQMVESYFGPFVPDKVQNVIFPPCSGCDTREGL